jgi:gluconokinase
MGVSGSGKTTIATGLARTLGWQLAEGDDFHSPESVAKMRAGIPLDDSERAPWLARIAGWIDDRRAAGRPGIVTCSALKRVYRDYLAQGRPEVRFVYLKLPPSVVAGRLKHRVGHFMPATLLGSQFATLEEPGPDEDVIVVDGTGAPDFIIRTLLGRLGVRSDGGI